MKRYLLARLGQSVVLVWLVATVVFFWVRLLPGGPFQTMFGRHATPETVARMNAEFGIDQPLYVQYVAWMRDLILLDWGRSVTSGEQVTTILLQAAPQSFSIAFVGAVFGLSLAIPAAIISTIHRNELPDNVATVAAYLGLSMPSFFIGIVLALVFGVRLGWFPVFGYTPLREGIGPWLRSVLLPSIAVGLPYGAVVMRMMRSSLADTLRAPYLRTARAKGVNGRVRLFKHALQNALLPVVTVAGIQFGIIVVGTVTVEFVFGINALGRLLVGSILERNYPVTQGVIIFIATVMICLNLLVDLTYTVLDPKISYGGENSL
ncbi:ABC transporter permease [Natrarchaeobius sp. A-rgal3]|uniref:ABC transporter permease n=1 Tax=Natrarchaeobius versutus TaxID=1679078 RepID=UPI00350EB2C9